jgi:hypothetical protein
MYGGASVAEWLSWLTSNHLPLTAVVLNPDMDFEFFRVRKLSRKRTEHQWILLSFPLLPDIINTHRCTRGFPTS